MRERSEGKEKRKGKRVDGVTEARRDDRAEIVRGH